MRVQHLKNMSEHNENSTSHSDGSASIMPNDIDVEQTLDSSGVEESDESFESTDPALDALRASVVYGELAADWIEDVVLPGLSAKQRKAYLNRILNNARKDPAREQFCKDTENFDDTLWLSGTWFSNFLHRAVHRRLTDLLSLSERDLLNEVNSDLHFFRDPDRENPDHFASREEFIDSLVRAQTLVYLPDAFKGLGRESFGEVIRELLDGTSDDTLVLEYNAPQEPERIILQSGEISEADLPFDKAGKLISGRLMKVWVDVDENGVLHGGKPRTVRLARKNATASNDPMLREKIRERVHFDLPTKKTDLPAGPHLLIFEATGGFSDAKTPGIQDIHIRLEPVVAGRNGERIFGYGTKAVPVGFSADRVRGNHQYVLADGTRALISKQDFSHIDLATGYALDFRGKPTKQFPKIRLDMVPEFGMVCRVYSLEEMRLQENIDQAILQYIMPESGREEWWSGYFQMPEGTASSLLTRTMPEKVRRQLVEMLKKTTQEFPLPLVVGSRIEGIRTGFAKTVEYLNSFGEKNTAEQVLEIAALRANRAFDALMHLHQQHETPSPAIAEKYFADYLSFFKALHGYKKATSTEGGSGQDLRGRFFPSDLDGDTAELLFHEAGIETITMPAPPIRSMALPTGDREHWPGAIHADVSHDTGMLFQQRIIPDKKHGPRENGDAYPTRLAIFLDEGRGIDGTQFHSASSTVYEHLQDLGLFLHGEEQSEQIEGRLRHYLTKFVECVDMFRGPLGYEMGRRVVLENFQTNIFGISDALLSHDIGRADLLISFFKDVIPQIEAEEKVRMGEEEKIAGSAANQAKRVSLADRIIERLASYNAAEYFEKNYPELYFGDETKAGIRGVLDKSYITARENVQRLRQWGFVMNTPKGTFLVDPFGTIRSSLLRGLLPTTEYKVDQYDKKYQPRCNGFINYNQKFRTGTVIIAADAKDSAGKPVRLPPRFCPAADGFSKGMLVKNDRDGARMFVMNETSYTLDGLHELLDALVPDKQNRIFLRDSNAVRLIMSGRCSQQDFMEMRKQFYAQSVISPESPQTEVRIPQQRDLAHERPLRATAKKEKKSLPKDTPKKTVEVDERFEQSAREIEDTIDRAPFETSAGIYRNALIREFESIRMGVGEETAAEIERMKNFMLRDARRLMARGALVFNGKRKQNRQQATAQGISLERFSENYFEVAARSSTISEYWREDILGESLKNELLNKWLRATA